MIYPNTYCDVACSTNKTIYIKSRVTFILGDISQNKIESAWLQKVSCVAVNAEKSRVKIYSEKSWINCWIKSCHLWNSIIFELIINHCRPHYIALLIYFEYYLIWRWVIRIAYSRIRSSISIIAVYLKHLVYKNQIIRAWKFYYSSFYL